ncbi:amino acid/polyamine/organocation transporter, APC superfamily [Reichenbachiella faecimaris]|uniref:Arginine/agmatine antiporter n=1 Tax=Reichenbachiella faecimaris TaxID=692418 RepID=A0A1W2G7V5_REIFA|nr:amino acid permease [Reichenbachiella faecimaris]SMD32408.1 amino acid/polyamine/organocation transporter, APC superfamily [Reichenbachiella faecimaris]
MSEKQSKIGLWTTTALVVGNTIGSGIFLLPSSLASFGSISLIGWMVTTVGSMAIALTFGYLSKHIPKTGGPYAYTKASFGDFAAFWVAWGYWISIWVGSAAIVTAFIAYLGVFFPYLTENSFAGLIMALTTLWFLVWVNSKGIKTAGRLALVTTIIKILPIILVGCIGIFYLDWNHFESFNISGKSDLKAILATVSITLWAFLGIESASVAGENVKDPEKNIGKATVIGTSVLGLLYMISSVAIIGLVSPLDLQQSTAPFADAAAILWGENGRYIIAAGATISCFGALNGWTLLVGQMPLAAAQDALFPREFKKLNKHGTPLFGIIFSTVLVSILVVMGKSDGLIKQFQFMILLATIACVIPYVFSTAGYFIISAEKGLFGKEGHLSKIIIAAIGFIFSVWAIAGSGNDTVFWGFILLLIGIPFYIIIQVRKKQIK